MLASRTFSQPVTAAEFILSEWMSEVAVGIQVCFVCMCVVCARMLCDNGV